MDVIGQSARALSVALAAGEISAVDLMRATLTRIGAVNAAVNAVISLRDREALMGEARLSDTMRRAAGAQGWMHGLPIAIKDLVAARGLPHTEGSPIYRDRMPDTDAAILVRMRAAGAIVIGKTNVPQFGLGSHSVNPVYGATRNPFDLSLTAGGSSGGAGAALATGMVSVADGSDMMGSLRNPAAWNDVYGFRPTVGTIQSDPGDAVFSHRLSTLGPMARTIDDLQALLDTLAGASVTTAPTALRAHTPRIGWLGDWGGAYATELGIMDLAQGALRVMEGIGWSITPLSAPFSRDEMWQSWCDLRAFAVVMQHGALWRDEQTRAQLNPQISWEITRGLALSVEVVEAAAAIRLRWLATLADLFTRFDALVLPATQIWPFPVSWDWPREIAGQGMDSYHRWMEVVVPASLAGVPAVALPAGFGLTGLPGGVQMIGPAGGDAALLALAARYEEAIGPRAIRDPV